MRPPLNLADAAVCSGQATNVVAYRAVNQGRQGRFGQARSTNAADNEEAYLAPFGVGAPVIKNALLVKKFMSDYRDLPGVAGRDLARCLRPCPAQPESGDVRPGA